LVVPFHLRRRAIKYCRVAGSGRRMRRGPLNFYVAVFRQGPSSAQNNHVAQSSGAYAEGSYLSIWAKRLSSGLGQRMRRGPLHFKGVHRQSICIEHLTFYVACSGDACAEGSVAVCQTPHAQRAPWLCVRRRMRRGLHGCVQTTHAQKVPKLSRCSMIRWRQCCQGLLRSEFRRGMRRGLRGCVSDGACLEGS
jgi:hypothetical protein